MGADICAEYILLNSESAENMAFAEFRIKLSKETVINQKISVSENGVDITLCGEGEVGMMIPVFDFDGANNTNIKFSENSVSIEYNGAVCVCSFDGEISKDFKYYYNRNGRYKVFKMAGKHLVIKIN